MDGCSVLRSKVSAKSGLLDDSSGFLTLLVYCWVITASQFELNERSPGALNRPLISHEQVILVQLGIGDGLAPGAVVCRGVSF